jgi:flagellar P-ring protein precursor FlgI
MRSFLALLAALVLGLGASDPALAAKSRIKDIVEFEGNRTNSLVGTGLVVGLAGTGDNLRNSPATRQAIENMMERLGLNIRDANLNTKNVAVVVVTANLPPFAAAGSKIDVSVSAAGDAKSLLGGTLLVTPLIGADGEAYAVAQGTLQTGSVSASGASGSFVSKGVPTAGTIVSGATVEREIAFSFDSLKQMRLTLRNPDFTTAQRVASVINQNFPGTAIANSPTIVSVRPPNGQRINDFAASIENLEVEPDYPAKVVIDEVAGVVVLNRAVRIAPVAVVHGNLTISVQEQPAVSQPTPLSRGGETAVVPQSSVSVEEEMGKQFVMIRENASLADLTNGLNALGITPRDMIAILQTIKANGALQAEIEVK